MGKHACIWTGVSPHPLPSSPCGGRRGGRQERKRRRRMPGKILFRQTPFSPFLVSLGKHRRAVWQESHVILLLLSPSPFLLLAIQWPWGHARGVAALCDLPPFVRLLLLPSFPLPFLLLVGQRRIGGSEETLSSLLLRSDAGRCGGGIKEGRRRRRRTWGGRALSIYQRYTEADQEACVPYGGYTRYREILVAPFFSPGPPKLEA